MQDELRELPETQQRPDLRDIRFTTRYKQDPNNPAEMLRVDWVTWSVFGESQVAKTSAPVHRLMPKKSRKASVHWPIVGPLYDAWLENREAPVNGTPLEAWNGLDASEIQYLRERLKVETLEQFANMPDGQKSRAQIPGIRERTKRAKMFLEAQQSTAEVQKALHERDTQIDRMEAMLQQQREMIERLAAQHQAAQETVTPEQFGAVADAATDDTDAVEAAVEADKPKRGPGRPKKSEEAA